MLAPLIASMISRWFLRASFFLSRFVFFSFLAICVTSAIFPLLLPHVHLNIGLRRRRRELGDWIVEQQRRQIIPWPFTAVWPAAEQRLDTRTSHFDGVPASFPRWSLRRCAFLSCHSLSCSSGRLWSHASLERAKRAYLLSSANNGYHCCCHCCCFWIGRWEVV